ncbi:hypothetical protein ACH427_04405 [Streptomyces sp. NPDC020379]|uniref:hypothetical protein n=1 Tax=Streptomyces sp. NPDC020379 TaxID=3365071 RepID=UPI0037AC4281
MARAQTRMYELPDGRQTCVYELPDGRLCGALVKGRPFLMSLNGEDYALPLCGKDVLDFESKLEALLRYSYRPEKVTKGRLWRDGTGVLATRDDIAEWLTKLWKNNRDAFNPGERAAVQALVEARGGPDQPMYRKGRMSNDCIAAWRRLRPLLEDRDEAWDPRQRGAGDRAALAELRDELESNTERFTAGEAMLIMRLSEDEPLPREAAILYGKVVAWRQMAQQAH